MSYCLRNSEYDKKYGALRNILLYTVHVKQYSKHMVTPQISCHLGCSHISFHDLIPCQYFKHE